jgi:hypothetical protein
VLIEGALRPTGRLYRLLDPAPWVWSQNPGDFAFGEGRDLLEAARNAGERSPRLSTIWLAELAGSKIDVPDPDRNVERDLDDLIAEVRGELGLGDGERLKVVLVGNHTTATDSVTDKLNGLYAHLEFPKYKRLREVLRGDREFIKNLYEVFGSRRDRVEVLWLRDVTSGLAASFGPERPCPPHLEAVAALAREKIGQLHRVRLNGKYHPMRPSLPFLFVRDGSEGDYNVWIGPNNKGGFERPFSTHDKLLEEFARWRKRTGNCNEAVLSMLLGDNLSEHNPLDPPIVTDRTLDKCFEADVSAVLLDERVGADFSGPALRKDPAPVFKA